MHASGKGYRFGGFLLIFPDHSVGLADLPELTAHVGKGKAWRLHFGNGVELQADKPGDFGIAYLEAFFREGANGNEIAGYQIVTPSGETFPEGELEERRADFLQRISFEGYRLGKRATRFLSLAGGIVPEVPGFQFGEGRAERLAA